jgi:hypothetical protein
VRRSSGEGERGGRRRKISQGGRRIKTRAFRKVMTFKKKAMTRAVGGRMCMYMKPKLRASGKSDWYLTMRKPKGCQWNSGDGWKLSQPRWVHQNKDSVVDKLVVDPNIWCNIVEKFL